MGDRCWLVIHVAEGDIPALESVADKPDEVEHEDGYVYGYVAEANYAWWSPLHELAQQGVPFWGQSGTGDEYSAGCFAAAGGVIAWPNAVEGLPAVRYEPSGPLPGDVEEAKLYFDLLQQAQEQVRQRNKRGQT